MLRSNFLMNYLLLIGIGILWGSQFMLNDIAIASLSPAVIATGRVVIGAITMMILLIMVRGENTSSHIRVINSFSVKLRFILIALFEGVIPFFSIAWGQQYVDSSVAAILVGTVPLFTALFVSLFIPHEKITVGTILSVLIGFVGLLTLILPTVKLNQFSHLLAELAILGGSMSFAIAITLIRTMPPISSIRLTRNVLAIASIPLVLYIVFFAPNQLGRFEFKVFGAVLALGIFCSGIVYVMYVKLINRAGATFASMSNYLVPLFGTLFGVCLMGDKLHVSIVLALIVILLSLVINKIPFFRRRASDTTTSRTEKEMNYVRE